MEPVISQHHATASLHILSGRRRAADAKRKLPPWSYVVGAMLALLAAGGIVYPIFGLVLLVALIAAAGVVAIVRRPILGIGLLLILWPLYPSVRAVLLSQNAMAPVSWIMLWQDALLFTVALGAILHRIRSRRRLVLQAADAAALFYVGIGIYGGALTLLTRHPYYLIFGLHYILLPPMVYFVVRLCAPDEAQIQRLLRLVFLVYGFAALIGLYTYFLMPEWALRLADGARAEMRRLQTAASGDYWRLYWRMQGVLWEENVWGSLSAFASLLGFARVTATRHAKTIALFALLATLCLFLSVSRGSIASWGVGMVVLALLRSRYGWRQRLLLGGMAVALGIVFTIFSTDPRIAMLLRASDDLGISRGTFGDSRLPQWQMGWDIFLRNPSGVGIGTVGYGANAARITLALVPDGNYISVLAETGVVGVTLLFCAFAAIVIALVRGLQRLYPRPWLAQGLLAYLCGMFVHAVGANPFEYYWTFPMFWLLYALYLRGGEISATSPASSVAPAVSPPRAIASRAAVVRPIHP